jgi:hypothetical protein
MKDDEPCARRLCIAVIGHPAFVHSICIEWLRWWRRNLLAVLSSLDNPSGQLFSHSTTTTFPVCLFFIQLRTDYSSCFVPLWVRWPWWPLPRLSLSLLQFQSSMSTMAMDWSIHLPPSYSLSVLAVCLASGPRGACIGLRMSRTIW